MRGLRRGLSRRGLAGAAGRAPRHTPAAELASAFLRLLNSTRLKCCRGFYFAFAPANLAEVNDGREGTVSSSGQGKRAREHSSITRPLRRFHAGHRGDRAADPGHAVGGDDVAAGVARRCEGTRGGYRSPRTDKPSYDGLSFTISAWRVKRRARSARPPVRLEEPLGVVCLIPDCGAVSSALVSAVDGPAVRVVADFAEELAPPGLLDKVEDFGGPEFKLAG